MTNSTIFNSLDNLDPGKIQQRRKTVQPRADRFQ